jgi:hypothetical protein
VLVGSSFFSSISGQRKRKREKGRRKRKRRKRKHPKSPEQMRKRMRKRKHPKSPGEKGSIPKVLGRWVVCGRD